MGVFIKQILRGTYAMFFKSGKTRLMTPYRKKVKAYVVKLTKNRKAKDEILAQIIARTFIGECPTGYVPYHKKWLPI